MNSGFRWTMLAGALLLAAAVGYFAYNAGVANGIEQSGKIVAAPPGAVPYYYWHGPHFGGFFFPFFFILFALLAFRGFRGHHHRRCRYERYDEDRPRG